MEVFLYFLARISREDSLNKFRVLQGCEEKEIEPLRALPALLRTDAFLQVPEDFEWNRLQPVCF
jgi:hypothetical protein